MIIKCVFDFHTVASQCFFPPVKCGKAMVTSSVRPPCNHAVLILYFWRKEFIHANITAVVQELYETVIMATVHVLFFMFTVLRLNGAEGHALKYKMSHCRCLIEKCIWLQKTIYFVFKRLTCETFCLKVENWVDLTA